jgi:hypothetical protein
VAIGHVLSWAGPVHYAEPENDPRWSTKLRNFGTWAAGPWADTSVSEMTGGIGEALGGFLGAATLHDVPANLEEAGQRIKNRQYLQAVGPIISSIPIAPGAGAVGKT